MDEELVKSVLFFARSEIERCLPEALRAVVELCGAPPGWRDAASPGLVHSHRAVGLADRFERAVLSRQISIQTNPTARLRVRHQTSSQPPQKTPPTPPEDEESTWFEVTALDDYGQPLDGLNLVFSSGSERKTVTTDESGKARWPDAKNSFASVNVASIQQLRDIIHPRWESPRAGSPLQDENIQRVALKDDITSLSLVAQVPALFAVVPHVVRVRLLGLYFDFAKAFLLPSALNGIRRLRELYNKYPKAKVLSVGHTDSKGDDLYNEKLSLERAKAVGDYLTDNVEAWLAWYGAGTSWEKAWGKTEDCHMLATLMNGDAPFYDGNYRRAVTDYQTARGLPQRFPPDPTTRRSLIKDYMGIDGTSLPGGTQVTTHGCGEYFLDVEPGTDDRNRRVELYVFNGPITPPPAGDISKPGALDYPAWSALASETYDFSAGDASDFAEIALLAGDRTSLPNAPCCLQGDPDPHHSDGDAVVFVYRKKAETLDIEWSAAADQATLPWPYKKTVYFTFPAGDEGTKRKLHNLGYDESLPDVWRIRLFQRDRGKPETVELAALQADVDHDHDGPAPTGAAGGAAPESQRPVVRITAGVRRTLIVRVTTSVAPHTPVAGATVKITGPQTVDASSDANGEALFLGIPAGNYSISVKKKKCADATAAVTLGSAAQIAVQLQPGKDVVEVNLPVVETISHAPPQWNGTYSWQSRYELTIDYATHTATATVRLKLNGTITDAQKGAWKAAIESKWNNKVKLVCADDPTQFLVSVAVSYVTSGQHQVVTVAPPNPVGHVGLGGTSSMTDWGADDTVDTTHEFGHMLGNVEEYFTTNGTDYTYGGTKAGFRDPDGGIMNNPSRDPLPRNYETIRQQASTTMGSACTTQIAP